MPNRLPILILSSIVAAVLVGGNAPSQQLVAPTTQIVTRQFSYVPAYTTVSVGSRIAWVNRDREAHTITSDVGLFNAEIGPGERFTFTFTEPGAYFFFCLPHDWMIGEITVVVPDAEAIQYPD